MSTARMSFRGSAAPSRHGMHAGGSRVWRVQAQEQQFGLSWRLFLFGLFLLLFAVAGSFVYVREITTTAASGYDISLLERRAAELRADEQRLRIEAAELESLRRVEERLKTLQLTPVSSVTYTSPLVTGAVAGLVPVGTARR